MDKSTRRLLTGIIAVSLLVRIAAIVGLQAWEHPNPMEHGPVAIGYMMGNGFSFNTGWGYYGKTAVQSPTYPIVLVTMFTLFGTDTPQAYAAALLLNAMIAALTAAMLFAMVRELGGRKRTALLAAIAFALWPTQVYLVTNAQALAIITACVVGMIWMFNRAIRTRSAWDWAAFSAFGCLGAVTESVMLSVMFLTGCFILVWRAWPIRLRVRNAAILLAFTAALQGSWIVRNYLVFGTFVPTKTTFWCNVWKSANPYATGADRLSLTEPDRMKLYRQEGDTADIHQYAKLTPEQNRALTGKNEVQQEDLFRRWALRWIGENPGRYLQLCGIRFVKTIWVEWDHPKSTSLLYIAARTFILFFGTAGVILAWREGWRLGFALFVLSVCLLTYTLVITAARFSLPHEPFFLAVSALVGEKWFIQPVRARLRGT